MKVLKYFLCSLKTTIHGPCQDALNPCEIIFLVKDQDGDDTLRFLETLNENAMKNMREMVSLKVLQKNHFYSLRTKQSIKW